MEFQVKITSDGQHLCATGRQIPPALPRMLSLVSLCSSHCSPYRTFRDPVSGDSSFAQQSLQISAAHLVLLCQLSSRGAQPNSFFPLQGGNSHRGDDLCMWRIPNTACSCGNTWSTDQAAPTPPQNGAEMVNVLLKHSGIKTRHVHARWVFTVGSEAI